MIDSPFHHLRLSSQGNILRKQVSSSAVHGMTIEEDQAVHFADADASGGVAAAAITTAKARRPRRNVSFAPADGSGDLEEGGISQSDADGVTGPEKGEGDGGERGMPQMLPEYRMRLLTGLKQFYRAKYEEGILGVKVRSGVIFLI